MTRHKAIYQNLTKAQSNSFARDQRISYQFNMTKFLLSLFLFLSPLSAQAAPEEMNGYVADQFGDFAKSWRLITVRYRKDSGEMRFTYANDLAWETLSKNSVNYPDGAVFTKISVITAEDPSFPSSMVPSGSRRVQFMVKNADRHKDTDGWGYALFDANGKLYPGDTATASKACAACHRLVPERGYVFSQPMAITGLPQQSQHPFGKRLQFESLKIGQLSHEAQKVLKDFKQVRSLKGELRKNLFSGTLDEVRPLLANEVLSSNLPAILLSEDKTQFSLVIPDLDSKNCSNKQLALKGLHTVLSKAQPLFEIKFCGDKPIAK